MLVFFVARSKALGIIETLICPMKTRSTSCSTSRYGHTRFRPYPVGSGVLNVLVRVTCCLWLCFSVVMHSSIRWLVGDDLQNPNLDSDITILNCGRKLTCSICVCSKARDLQHFYTCSLPAISKIDASAAVVTSTGKCRRATRRPSLSRG